MHLGDDAGEHVGTGGRRHPVTQVDHVPRGAAPGLQALLDRAVQDGLGGRQQRRIDIALHRAGPAGAGGKDVRGLPQPDALIDADGVGPLAHIGQEEGGARAEVDEGRRGAGGGGQGLARDAQGQGGVGLDALAVVGGRQAARPGVEELGGRGPGAHLGGHEAAGQVRAPGHEPVPAAGVGVHEGAGRQVVAAGAALDHVGGQGEGGATETDDRGPPGLACAVLQSGARPRAQVLALAGLPGGAELGDDAAHRLGDGLQGRLRQDPGGGGVGRAAVGLTARAGCIRCACWVRRKCCARGERLDLLGAAHRGVQDGPHPLNDPHRDTGQEQGDHDVGEEHGRVHAVAAYRLEGDLGREPGVEAGLQHGPVPPQAPVLRERAARLAHEPHGCARGGAAAERLQERGPGET